MGEAIGCKRHVECHPPVWFSRELIHVRSYLTDVYDALERGMGRSCLAQDSGVTSPIW